MLHLCREIRDMTSEHETTYRCGLNLARSVLPIPHGSLSVFDHTPTLLHGSQLTDLTHWARQDPRTLFDGTG